MAMWMGEMREKKRKEKQVSIAHSQSAEKHGVKEMRRNGIADECGAKAEKPWKIYTEIFISSQNE